MKSAMLVLVGLAVVAAVVVGTMAITFGATTPARIELRGVIQTINVAALDLVVSGVVVHTNPNTRIFLAPGGPVKLTDLMVGQDVLVEGFGLADGSVLASVIVGLPR